ncbi:uncharacterized protein LOC135484923 [Lineus longissimus]|uniref:uncharacterized protein LOC135484923 n=1 Tax=Lineus longissimus TaxID=88925 RepID=UPI00315C92DF
MVKRPLILTLIGLMQLAATQANIYQEFACANGLGYRTGDCPGNYISFQVLNLQACSDKCKATSSCVAFLWNEASHCYIKSKSCTSTNTANPANHFFDKTATTYQAFACANGLGYRPGDCPGNYISFQVLNLQACSDKCKVTSSCVAFLWHEASHCYIKSKSCTNTNTANPSNHFFDKTEICNGHAGLCKLTFDKVTFPGTHNSGANRVMKYGGWPYFPALSCPYRNQDYTFTAQLDFGIRFFDIDTRAKGDTAYASHATAYGRKLWEIIRDIDNWLNNPSHRNEVIAIRFDDTTMPSGFGRFIPIFRDYFTGANGKVGINAVTGSWPTLGEAVAQNKRVFIFMVDHFCDSSCRSSHPYIHSANFYGDTWLDLKVTSSCGSMPEDTRRKCASISKDMIIVSAFASLGLCVNDMQKLCNRYIRPSAMSCYNERKKRGKTVNFLMADYVNQANTNENVITVANELNQLNMGN